MTFIGLAWLGLAFLATATLAGLSRGGRLDEVKSLEAAPAATTHPLMQIPAPRSADVSVEVAATGSR